MTANEVDDLVRRACGKVQMEIMEKFWPLDMATGAEMLQIEIRKQLGTFPQSRAEATPAPAMPPSRSA